MTHLHSLLKVETASLHEQCETLPFFAALHAGSLPKLSIVNFLRSLAIIHAVLERCLSKASHHGASELYALTNPKVPLLVADLGALDTETLPSITPAIMCALEYADEVLTGADDPLKLIGPLYVLEGMQNGALALKKRYARALSIPIAQLSYFGCYHGSTTKHWKALVRRLDTISLTNDQSAAVVASAVRCFECVSRIGANVYPYSGKDLKHHVAAINFEAGDHVMPQDPLEIDLALRAAKAAWEDYPYLKHRYGERGRRFTYSDGCWLVALTRTPKRGAVTKSLEWLRTLLASRGIPTVVLEAHLKAILRTIDAEFPDRRDRPTQFDPFLSDRRAERSSLFGAQGVSHLIEVFDKRFRACTGFKIESTAELIVSAWVDEHSGISGSRSSLANWLTDGERFAADWIANVQELLGNLDMGNYCNVANESH